MVCVIQGVFEVWIWAEDIAGDCGSLIERRQAERFTQTEEVSAVCFVYCECKRTAEASREEMSLHFGREFKITELLKQERTAEVCQTLSKPAPPHFLYKGSREAAETGGGSLTEQSDEQIIV